MLTNLSIIFPLYNEAKRLHLVFKDIKKFNKKNKFSKIEYIFVDDGSVDKSTKKIQEFIKNNQKKNIYYRLIKLHKNYGKGYALKIGVKNSKYAWILTIDSDISVSLNQINIWNKKYNIFKESKNKIYFGSRNLANSTVHTKVYRKFLGFFFSNIVTFLFKTEIKDTQCGFKLYSSVVAKIIFNKLRNFGYSHDVEIVGLSKKNRIIIKELPLIWRHRSDSKLNIFLDPFKMFFDLIFIKLRIKI